MNSLSNISQAKYDYKFEVMGNNDVFQKRKQLQVNKFCFLEILKVMKE